MLMNGQKVNHLVINGESYTADDFLPAKYDFGKSFTDYNYFHYILDGKDAFYEHYQVTNLHPDDLTIKWAMVNQIAFYKGEEYALINCWLDDQTNGTGMYGGYAWIKASDLGGMTRVDATGGVNKPSYLLFIYCCLTWLALGVTSSC